MATLSNPVVLPTLLQLTQTFSRRRLLVVGDLVADHYIYGQTERVSREAPVLIVRYENSEVKLGGGANAAANIRSLGGQVMVVGALGKDEMGRDLVSQFELAGIQLVVPWSEEVQTETKTRILAGGSNTTRQQMLRVDRGASGNLPSKLRLEISRAIAKAAKDVDAVVVSDYGAGVVGDEVQQVLRQLAADGLTVCVDSRYRLHKFAGVTVCKPNEPELEMLTGAALHSDDDLIAAGRRGVEQLGCRALLVTRGRNGMAVFDARGQVDIIPVHGAQEAVDVTGAGDTVISAFTLALAAGGSIADAARLANVAGALVVQKQGTATVSIAELQHELSGAMK